MIHNKGDAKNTVLLNLSQNEMFCLSQYHIIFGMENSLFSYALFFEHTEKRRDNRHAVFYKHTYPS